MKVHTENTMMGNRSYLNGFYDVSLHLWIPWRYTNACYYYHYEKNTNSTQKQIQRQCLKTSSGSTVLLMKFGKLFQTPVPEHKVSIWQMA